MKSSAKFVTFVPLIGLGVLIVLLAGDPWDGWRVLGSAFMLFGFAMLTVARINLGNAFSVTAQATDLVTTGIYSRIRNPIYVFSTIGLAGLFLYIERPMLLLLIPPLAAVQTWRARNESRVLQGKFGEAYRRYKAGTWF
jgi:protein-S-isoprenylcysteine O-methyltransferase Ste14